VLDTLPPDWTHLQFDLRIEEEDRYVELAPIVAQVNAWPLSKDEYHWRFNTMREFGHAAAPQTVKGLLAALDKLGIHGELAVREVRQLRDRYIPEAFANTKADVLVGGETSRDIDYFDTMDYWLPIVFAFVLGFSFVLLTVAFRSIVVAAKAIVLNLLSVGAAYGLLVLVFEKGVGNGLLGFRQVDSVVAWVPLFLFCVLFGLSMDYHVFLLSRIRERFVRTGDNDDAVAWGVGTTARLITGAALIIIVVFVGFSTGDLVMFQQMGFGVAVALLLDATIVRTVLVPSAMKLLGRRNWYLPSWLQWLPELEVEHHEPG
jgi:RND superfamily putative drug exporter